MSEVLQQDLSQGVGSHSMLMIELLFEEKPDIIDIDTLQKAAEETFGETDVVSGDGKLLSLAVKKHIGHYADGKVCPAFAVLGQDLTFDSKDIDVLERSQFWDVRDGEELLDRCRYKCFVSDMMSAGLDYKERCDLVMDWLECVLPLFPGCIAVRTVASGKLMTPDSILNGSIPKDRRFISRCVNARFFRIEGTDSDMVVDTLGMFAVDLPEVQLHFHGLDPNAVVNYVYSICGYNYDNNAPIESGEVIDGLGDDGKISMDVQWRCQYEDSLIQPVRCVLDVNAGEFAAGQR
ncbi:MAG: DUF4261 domain-containing protein [Ruminococcus sp.]|nr:DUF4261 domain-containing protein [Ruminococcus sp.]